MHFDDLVALGLTVRRALRGPAVDIVVCVWKLI